MKVLNGLGLVAMLALTACGSNKGSKVFDEYFGDYTVVATDDEEADELCKVTDASIRRTQWEGHDAVLLEATRSANADGTGCSARRSTILTVSGMDGVTCEGKEAQARCTKGDSVWTVTMAREGSLVRINTVMTGENNEETTWLLRRK